ncbi:hypothetical protein, partial [Streptococcus suis]|uniref:hypothetical protein n=1 Tax=Streptococcus suis TaxID=1307 RepID=UPI001374DF7B
KKAFLFCPDGVVSALKQPFFSKNSKKDKHQNDVCLQSETTSYAGGCQGFEPPFLFPVII